MLALLLAGAICAHAADPEVSLPDLIQGAQQWAQDNLDSNFLNALPEPDERTVQQFFAEFQRRYRRRRRDLGNLIRRRGAILDRSLEIPQGDLLRHGQTRREDCGGR